MIVLMKHKKVRMLFHFLDCGMFILSLALTRAGKRSEAVQFLQQLANNAINEARCVSMCVSVGRKAGCVCK